MEESVPWQLRFPGNAPFEHMKAVFDRLATICRKGDLEEFRRAVGTWHGNFDFKGVPPDVMEGTATDLASARAEASAGEWGAAIQGVQAATDRWRIRTRV